MSEPDPHREYEEQFGSVGRRGIRSGRKARGSREKYVRREAERLGVAESEIPVLHAGGTSRPLHIHHLLGNRILVRRTRKLCIR